MPSPILVPLDGSTFSEQALPTAAQLARRTGAPLHIVQVHEAAASYAPPDGVPVYDHRWDAALRVQEEEYLHGVAARCMEQVGVAPRTELLDGPVSAALAAYVTALDVELIVMTTHGRGGISRAWVGSVADALVRRAAVPVLLIRSRSEELRWDSAPQVRKILIPLDGSELSEGIIEPAVGLGKLTGATYALLRVVLPVPFVSPGGMAPAVFTQAGAAESTADAAAYLDRVAAPLRARGLHVETETLVHAIPAVAVLDYAATHGCDGIAMATHGRGGWSRLALGSVADRVMRATLLPVLLYRAPSDASAGARPAAAADVAP
jgi:nucleotide-binding universal stress UspA family protein